MNERRQDIRHDRDDRHDRDEREDEITDESRPADASMMTEGIGGMPDLDPEERATVSDVDGDNVEEDKARRVQ